MVIAANGEERDNNISVVQKVKLAPQSRAVFSAINIKQGRRERGT